MITISLYGSRHQEPHASQLADFLDALASHSGSIRLLIEPRFNTYLTDCLGIDPHAEPISDTSPDADVALSIGGDGTFLRASRLIAQHGTPIMGINTGHLGYLSAATLSDGNEVIADILAGRFRIEPRSVLSVQSGHPALRYTMYALNEVAILRRDTASMITVDTELNGEPLASYRGDGLIISTPTGSSGYNLSVGGPLVEPTAPCWIIAPIAPHSLNMRPLVVSDASTLRVSARARSESYLLSVDGKATVLPIDATLHISRAPYTVNVVHRQGQTFIDTIRTKLLWGSD
ncbi:MAG: NAD(+)/NADH kinase [Muribaculaceae bacterium]|nr:NAD(+)/NADH kinase [Muribaculaceae bacterium]